MKIKSKIRDQALRWVLYSLAPLMILLMIMACLNVRLRPGAEAPFSTVSPSVTWIEEPLHPNGDPDYLQWLNRQLAVGVTPENNLVLEILKITGPFGEDGKKLADDFLRALHHTPESTAGPYLDVLNKQYLDSIAWENKNPMIEFAGKTLSNADCLRLALEFPLNAGTIPWLDQWLKNNESVLKAVRDASYKAGFYAPLTGRPLLKSSLSFQVNLKSVCQSLLVASMLRIGNGDLGEAILDQLAVVRIGRSCQSSPSGLASWQIGIDIENAGLSTLQQTVLTGKLSVTELSRLKEQLNELPPHPPLTIAQFNAERVVILDSLLFEWRYGYVDPNADSMPKGPPFMLYDSDEALIVVNQGYTRIETILSVADTKERLREIEKLHKDLEQSEQKLRTAVPMTYTAKGRGRAMGQIAWTMLCPDILRPFQKDTHSPTWVDLLRLCIALEEFRLEKGKRPADLSELMPEFLDVLPNDPGTNGKYNYSPDSKARIVLYSFGPDGQDDEGRNSKQPRDSIDDIAVRRPFESIELWVSENVNHSPRESLTLDELIKNKRNQ